MTLQWVLCKTPEQSHREISEHWLLVWGLQVRLEWEQQLHQSSTCSWLDCTNSPHTGANDALSSVQKASDLLDICRTPCRGLACLSFFIWKTAKKSISALPVQEQNLVPTCFCPWSFLSGTSLSLLLQEGLGAYAGRRLKENIKRKTRLLDVRLPPGFGESVIVRCDWPFWSSLHRGFTLKRINLLLVLLSELTFSFFPWSY